MAKTKRRFYGKDKFTDRHFLFIFHTNLLRFCFLVWYCQFDVSPVTVQILILNYTRTMCVGVVNVNVILVKMHVYKSSFTRAWTFYTNASNSLCKTYTHTYLPL